MKVSILDAARVTHEVNRAYCAAIGDNSQVAWDEAAEWQRESALAGVQSILHGTANSPEEQHAAWMQLKLDEGWVFGETKDAEKKTHPCIVPYAELPAAQKVKDFLFRAVVQALR
jgi:hypothetical protein